VGVAAWQAHAGEASPHPSEGGECREKLKCGGLIVVRAGVGTWVEAYDNLDFFASFCVKTKRRKKKQRKGEKPFAPTIDRIGKRISLVS
jgi:hypothetical protein